MMDDFNSMTGDFLNQEDFPLTVEEYEEQVRYGRKILAQDLFNSMLRYYPEALPEVIELLDKLHNQYNSPEARFERGRIK